MSGVFDQLKKEIKSFNETKNLTLNDQDVLLVYQYVKRKKRFLEDPNQDFEPVLLMNPLRMEFVASKAQIERQKEIKRQRLIDTQYHNNYLSDATFDDFDLVNEERKSALIKSKAFVESFDIKKFNKGLYIHGQNRTGKTFLLSCIANAISLKNVEVVFVYVPDLIRSIHASMTDNTVEKKVNQLKNCGLLILDDIGSATMSNWFRDQVLGAIIQYRLSVGLAVLMSSNLEIKQLMSYLIDPSVENDRINAVRITTRILELTEPVALHQSRYTKK